MKEQKQGGRKLPSLRSISKGQVMLTGAALATTGIADIALHADKTGMFLGLLAAGAVAHQSKNILDSLVPGHDAPQVVEMTSRVLESTSSMPEEQRSQDAFSKLQRLIGLKPSAPVQPTSNEDVESAPAPHEAEEIPSDDVPTQRIEQPPMTAIFPTYPEEETLRLGRVLATGQRFDPHFNALLGRGWVAAANQGFGKSILNGVIIEQAGKCGLPVIVLDHKGEYDTVKQLPFMRAFVAGAEGDVDYELTPENVDEFIEMVIEDQCQAIVKLPSYGSAWLGKATIAAAIGQGLMRYAEKQRKLRQPLLPCIIIMDEAQLYLPQNTNLLPPEAQQNKDVLNDLSNAYFALVSNGRSAGYTIGFATQSLTYIAKWAIKSSQVRIFGRHAEKNDLDMCADIIDPNVASRKDIEAFPSGVGVVFGFTDKPMVVKFDMKQSKDKSETPGMERLRQRRAARQERYYAPQPQQRSHDYQLNNEGVDTLLAEILGRPDVDPEDKRYTQPHEQRAQHYYQPVQQTPRPTYTPDLLPAKTSAQQREDAKLERALQLWNAGHASVRKLEAASGWSNGETRRIIQVLKEKGLIYRDA